MKSKYVELISKWKRAMTMNNKEEAFQYMEEANKLIMSGKVTDREKMAAKFIGWR